MKKRMTVLNLCLCAAMVALHIVLDLFCTIRIGNDYKISLASLPFVVIALLSGPVEGCITAAVGTFLSQLITFGLVPSTPFWVLAPTLQALTVGLLYMAFKRRTKVLPIAVSVTVGGFVLTIFNWIGSYFDGVVFNHYYTVPAWLAVLPIRLVTFVILAVVYTAIGIPLVKNLQKVCPAGYRQKKALEKKAAEAAKAQAGA